MPSMLSEFLIALPRISMPIMNSNPERGQPCLTPLLRKKCSLANPLFSTQLEMLHYKKHESIVEVGDLS